VALNRKTDVLILIRIRIDITNCSRSLRSLSWRNQWSASITQHGHGVKEASEASGMISNCDTPYGGLISVAYMISGFRNFCQYLTVERLVGRDNSGVPVQ
jgi:hypothetical protein